MVTSWLVVEAANTGGLWWPPSPAPLGETAWMFQPTPEQIEQQRQSMGGWYPCALCDGQDAVTGKRLSWHEFRHRDGRTAQVWRGQATDPELQALLDASPATSRPAPPEIPRWLERKGLIQLMVRVVTCIQWNKGALVGKPSRTP